MTKKLNFCIDVVPDDQARGNQLSETHFAMLKRHTDSVGQSLSAGMTQASKLGLEILQEREEKAGI